MTGTRISDKPLCGKRILVCGKGGSGKSTLAALLANVLQRRDYEVLVLDGDASNPEGLVRLLFGLGVEGEPKPLIEFFGGVDVVTCPVDDPSPLTRINDSAAVPENRIDLIKVIGSISFDQELIRLGLSGNALAECKAVPEVEIVVGHLEQAVSSRTA